jgi:hypothetical protein
MVCLRSRIYKAHVQWEKEKCSHWCAKWKLAFSRSLSDGLFNQYSRIGKIVSFCVDFLHKVTDTYCIVLHHMATQCLYMSQVEALHLMAKQHLFFDYYFWSTITFGPISLRTPHIDHHETFIQQVQSGSVLIDHTNLVSANIECKLLQIYVCTMGVSDFNRDRIMWSHLGS